MVIQRYIEDFQAFMMKRPELNGKFDFQTQESTEAWKGKQEREIIMDFLKLNSLYSYVER